MPKLDLFLNDEFFEKLIKNGCTIELSYSEPFEYEDDDGNMVKEPARFHLEIRRYSFQLEDVQKIIEKIPMSWKFEGLEGDIDGTNVVLHFTKEG